MPMREFADNRLIAGAVQLATNYQAFTLPWTDKIALAGTAPGSGNALQGLSQAINAQIGEQAFQVGYGSWSIRGATPDGSQFLAGEVRLENDPSHAYVLVGDGLVTGAQVDPGATLPVALKLPDNQGWLVANVGATLRCRRGSDGWLSVGRDAALLPARATAVEVTRPGRPTEVVQLTD
jgi:hypothetical protein